MTATAPQTARTVRRRATIVLGLLVGAAASRCCGLQASSSPSQYRPGLVVLLVGALLVARVAAPWAAAAGAFLGAFVLVGLLASPTGTDNLTGRSGTAVACGQAVQLLGVLIALVSGSLAFRAEQRRH
ncbi:MAG: hypothetical protein JWO60_352 [Frankiales bacterium]|nr:hypothetical protein [Frankiales bacterium]